MHQYYLTLPPVRQRQLFYSHNEQTAPLSIQHRLTFSVLLSETGTDRPRNVTSLHIQRHDSARTVSTDRPVCESGLVKRSVAGEDARLLVGVRDHASLPHRLPPTNEAPCHLSFPAPRTRSQDAIPIVIPYHRSAIFHPAPRSAAASAVSAADPAIAPNT